MEKWKREAWGGVSADGREEKGERANGESGSTGRDEYEVTNYEVGVLKRTPKAASSMEIFIDRIIIYF
jgi:hypothetical protein